MKNLLLLIILPRCENETTERPLLFTFINDFQDSVLVPPFLNGFKHFLFKRLLRKSAFVLVNKIRRYVNCLFRVLKTGYYKNAIDMCYFELLF